MPAWAKLGVCLVLIAPSGSLTAAVKVPPIWPQIQGTFPRGGQQGTEVRVTIRGRNLQDCRAIRFRTPKLTANVVKSSPYEVEAVVSIAATAEPGRHDLRLASAHGSALSYFDVGTIEERVETEPNDDAARSQTLVFPAVINGIVKSGDYDYFKFDAKAGQVITFDVLATRNGSNADTVLSLLNSAGEELAYSDDHYGFKDPHLVNRFEKDGSYLVRVYGSSEAGCDTCDYRLLAGSIPHVELAMPGGGTRGKTVDFELRGVNLDKVGEVTLGDGVATGKVLSAEPGKARVQMTIPESAPVGELRLHAGGAMLPVPFVVSTYPEISVADASARSRRDPRPVTLPIVVNGVIDRPKAADYFVFRVDEPRPVVFDVQGMQLGFLTDPLVVIYDEMGKRLAYQDEPTTNTGKEPANMDPHLVFTPPKPGRYIAMVRDAQYRGDPAFLYRITMKHAKPDFSIKVIGTDDTLYRGRPNTVLVRVRRLEGWNAPVEVWADSLPSGVHAKPVIAGTANTPYTGTCGETHYLDGTNIEMEFTVDANASLEPSKIRLKGRGVFEGRTVEHDAKARYFRSRIRHIGDAEEDELSVMVADAPGAVISVPQNISLAKDNTASLTAIVTRLDGETGGELELALEAAADGLTLEAMPVAFKQTRADVKLRASRSAPGEFVLVGRANGAVIGKSHPIKIRSPK